MRAAADNGTRVTRLFSGRPARGLVNEFMERLQAEEQAVPSYPVQNALTGEIRTAAKQQGRLDYVALWAGQGVPLTRNLSAAELVGRLSDETEETLRRV